MKLNWFSPLPPAHSAIATYAAAVLPELARQPKSLCGASHLAHLPR
jgi:hypothetical protein